MEYQSTCYSFVSNKLVWSQISHKKRNDSLETWAEPPVLCTYVENQAILEAISSLPCIKM